MDVALRGSSPCATTCAILLMTKARQLGMRLNASLVGDPDDICHVPGPAVVYSPVLASCGVGRELGTGAVVVVPGAPDAELMVSMSTNGTGDWFTVDRSGGGRHPATQAYVRLSRDPRVPARHLAKELRRGMESVGMHAEPAVLDLLFGAPSDPLTRLSVALRAGRAMSGARGSPVTAWLSGAVDPERDPLPHAYDKAAFEDALRTGALQWILDGLAAPLQDRVDDWLQAARTVAGEDGGRDLELVHALAEIASHLVSLPPNSILPPLGAAEDAVAVAFGTALRAVGDENANAQLRSVFRFLGGRYVADAAHVYEVDSDPPPPGPLARWGWFCAQALRGKERAEELWPRIVDPPQ